MACCKVRWDGELASTWAAGGALLRAMLLPLLDGYSGRKAGVSDESAVGSPSLLHAALVQRRQELGVVSGLGHAFQHLLRSLRGIVGI